MNLPTNTLIEFWHNNKIQFGLITGDLGEKYQITDEKGHNLKISQKNILWPLGSGLTPQNFYEIVEAKNKEIAKAISEIDLELLWSSLTEDLKELSQRSYTISELADNYFNNHDLKYKSALLRLLTENKAYFKQKGEFFSPRKQNEVTASLKQNKALSEKADWQSWALRSIDNFISLKPEEIEIGTEEQKLLQKIDDFLFKKTNQEINSLLQKANPLKKPKILAYEILSKLNVLPAGTDYFISISRIDTRFAENVLQQAEKIKEHQAEESHSLSKDYICFSIDDQDTKEIDDAISFKDSGESIYIGIHITDLTRILSPGDLIDQEAYSRTSSIYLPTGTVPMIPVQISYNKASLLQDKIRPVFSIITEFNQNFKLQKWIFRRELITVNKRLNYDQVDQMLSNYDASEPYNCAINKISKITDFLRNQRRLNDALFLNPPEIKLQVAADKITVKHIDSNSLSRVMIAELMIIYNNLCAEYTLNNKIPFIYRWQAEPAPLPADFANDYSYDPLMIKKIFSCLKKSQISLQPQKHWGLGLNTYSQVSSPLRRYADMVLQRQIAAYLKGQNYPYTEQELLKVLATVELTARERYFLENRAKRYWLYKYFEQEGSSAVYEVIILDNSVAGYEIEIIGFYHKARLRTKETYKQGDIIKAQVATVIPEKNILEFNDKVVE